MTPNPTHPQPALLLNRLAHSHFCRLCFLDHRCILPGCIDWPEKICHVCWTDKSLPGASK